MSVCSRNLAKRSSFLAGSGIRGHVCWAKLSTCVLDPKASLFRTPFPPGSPSRPLCWPLPVAAAEVQQREPQHGVGGLGVGSGPVTTKCLTVGRVSHVAEPQFPYLEIGVLKVMNSTFSPIWFPSVPHLTSAPSRPVSCPWVNKFTR